MAYIKDVKSEIKKGLDDVKKGKGISHSSVEDLFKELKERAIKHIEDTTPIQRIQEKLKYKIKNLKDEQYFFKHLEDIIKNSKVVEIKEFLTMELERCSIHDGGKCNCHYKGEPKEKHVDGTSEFVDVAIYDPMKKDYWWVFVFETENLRKKDLEEDKVIDLKIKNDPEHDSIVDDAIPDFTSQDITNIYLNVTHFTKEIIINEIGNFINKYMKVDKKIVWSKKNKKF